MAVLLWPTRHIRSMIADGRRKVKTPFRRTPRLKIDVRVPSTGEPSPFAEMLAWCHANVAAWVQHGFMDKRAVPFRLGFLNAISRESIGPRAHFLAAAPLRPRLSASRKKGRFTAAPAR